jgi:hypothetical protein
MKLTELVLIVLKMSISLSVLELGLKATLADARTDKIITGGLNVAR